MSENEAIRKHAARGFLDMLVGYMRVSSDTDRQTMDLQRDALLEAGVANRATTSFTLVGHSADFTPSVPTRRA